MPGHDIIAVGGSAGALDALRTIVSTLPADLPAVKGRGGITVVQDPRDAAYADMPASALGQVGADYCLPLDAIGPTLARLAREPAPKPRGGVTVPSDLEWEAAVAEWDLERLKSSERPGRPSPFTCPDCKGDLWEFENTSGPLRFRCRTGHAWSP